MNNKTLLIVGVAVAAGLVIYFLMRRGQQGASNPALPPVFVSTPPRVQDAPFANPVGGSYGSVGTGVQIASGISNLFGSIKNLFSSPVSQTNTPLLSLAPPSGTFESSGDFINGDFSNFTSAAGGDNIENNDQSVYYQAYGM